MTPDEIDAMHSALLDDAIELWTNSNWRNGRAENPPDFDEDRWFPLAVQAEEARRAAYWQEAAE